MPIKNSNPLFKGFKILDGFINFLFGDDRNKTRQKLDKKDTKQTIDEINDENEIYMIEEQIREIYKDGKLIKNHKKIEILPQGNKKSLKVITNNITELKK